MSDTMYKFKGQVAKVNMHNTAINSWNSPQEFMVYASSANEAYTKVKKSLGSPGGEYEWDFRISSMEEVVWP